MIRTCGGAFIITMGSFMNEEPKKPKVNNFVKKADKINKLAILCLSRPKLCQKLPKNQPFLPLKFVVNYSPVVD
jgi:hypothetical protein